MNIALKLLGVILLNSLGIYIICKGTEATMDFAQDIKDACSKPKEAPVIKA